MIYIPNDSTNPYYNLALEEYILKQFDLDENIVLIWQNRPTVVVGRFQNTIEEINHDFVDNMSISVVRRMSGGGAVYHDLGNLNFTFIVKYDPKKSLDFKAFIDPVVKTLNILGIKAEFSSRNDITIDGKKFSGNAQYISKNKLLHHGTLLFKSNINNMQQALNVGNDKIESKGIKSVRNRVTNIADHLKPNITINDFKQILLRNIFNNKAITTCHLSSTDINIIQKLMIGKYITWEWNYGESPEYNFKNSLRFKFGKVEVRLNVKNGIIKKCKIYGDFLGMGDILNIEALLIGQKAGKPDIRSVLSSVNVEEYFGKITVDEIMKCFEGI